MSVSNRLFYAICDKDLHLNFVRWLKEKYPIMFKELANQFFLQIITSKEKGA